MNEYKILNLSAAINYLKHIDCDKKLLEKNLKRVKRFRLFYKIYVIILTIILTMLAIIISSNNILVELFAPLTTLFSVVYIILPKENEIKNKLIKLRKKEIVSKKFIKNFSKLLEKKGYNISADSLIKANVLNGKISIEEGNNTTIVRENKTYGTSKKTDKIYLTGYEYKINEKVIGNDSDIRYVDEDCPPIIAFSTVINIPKEPVLKIGKNNS